MNTTGSANDTLVIGAPPCPHCGGDQRLMTAFHGWHPVFCVHCGEELPSCLW